MSSRKFDAYCPTCKATHPVEVEVTDPPPQQIITQDTQRIQALQTEISEAHEELAAWQSMSKHRPVSEIMQHLAECPNCRPHLDEFVAGVGKKAIASLTPEQAKEIAKTHKLWPPPTVDLGLSRSARQ